MGSPRARDGGITPAPPGLTRRPRADLVTKPTLSLVIPAYNEESRLPATLSRVSEYLSGRAEPYEVLVVVNGSTDRTADVVKAAAQSDPRIQLLMTEVAGKGRAVRIGVEAAVGERIVFADADLSTPIEEVIALAERL